MHLFPYTLVAGLLLLVLLLPPFSLPRRLSTHLPGWVYPILGPAFIVSLQWLRGQRWGVPYWVYAFGAAVGLFLGLFGWYLKALGDRAKPAPGKAVDPDF